MRITPSLIILATIAVTGCATIQGSVAPMEGGQYKAVRIPGNKYTAHKIVDNDAGVTCKREKSAGYVVLSRDVHESKPPEMETGNKFADTAFLRSRPFVRILPGHLSQMTISGRVKMWRGGLRSSLSVAALFV
jgi:hypothetical protein